MAKANWLLQYEYERQVEEIVLNANEHKRTVFTIEMPGVEGNTYKGIPKNPDHCIDHEWRFVDIDVYKDAVFFECQWCECTKYVKINYEYTSNKLSMR
jgi:hypothetical protein